MKSIDEILRNPFVALVARGDDGAAIILHTDTAKLHVVLSTGLAWDHVSVSHRSRTPRYQEMKAVKRICFKEDEWAVEYHPPAENYISINNNVLHMWRPLGVDLPTPPEFMV